MPLLAREGKGERRRGAVVVHSGCTRCRRRLEHDARGEDETRELTPPRALSWPCPAQPRTDPTSPRAALPAPAISNQHPLAPHLAGRTSRGLSTPSPSGAPGELNGGTGDGPERWIGGDVESAGEGQRRVPVGGDGEVDAERRTTVPRGRVRRMGRKARESRRISSEA